MSRAQAYRQAQALTTLGRKLFFDPSLSASGRQPCASCHSPDHAFGPPNAQPVQYGGDDLKQPGTRAVPSLRYLQVTPPFTEHYYDEEGDESADNGPSGGLTWDGRVDRARDQASIPLLSPYEMANETPAAVVAKVLKADYAEEARRIMDKVAGGTSIDPAFATILRALEAYQQSYVEFYPYSSKYDAYLAGKTQLTPSESRGLAVFNDPAKGNCARCHPSARAKDGTLPQFTDFGLVALGVPRNNAIPANADPAYFDLGLCGPYRADLRGHAEYCGRFKTPTLRNVATRGTFFHNGSFHSLRDVVAFYATRDTSPELWYPRRADGSIAKFDDLPRAFWTNINGEPPFDRHLGDQPALTGDEIDDVVAFLATLTDAPDQATGR